MADALKRGSIFGVVVDSSTRVPAVLVAVERTRTYLLATSDPVTYVDDVAPEMFEQVVASEGEVHACH